MGAAVVGSLVIEASLGLAVGVAVVGSLVVGGLKTSWSSAHALTKI
jgi:hypothetical protein